MAYYVCGNRNCHFVFERVGEVSECPDCGHSFVRESNVDEIEEYKRNRDAKNP